MKHRHLKLAATAALTVLTAGSIAEARRGGDANRPARPETITCGLTFDGRTLVGTSSAVVQNAQAMLRGEAQGVSYVFSVRGKTAVARVTISETGQILTAQGAIEMLRRGGEASVAAVETEKRRGEDDANDGQTEREAGFQLGVALSARPQQPVVTLKCESTNQPAQGQ